MSADVDARTRVGTSQAVSLRAVILLAGSVAKNPFGEGVDRAPLDLPVENGRTVFDVWREQLARLADDLGLPSLDVLVAIDRESAAPRTPQNGSGRGVKFEVVRDSAEYRGTAGVAKDLTRNFNDDDLVLLAGASQIQREPLIDVFRALEFGEEAVSVVPHGASEHAGLFLLRCDRLRDVSDVGFVDLKEQAIPSARHRVPLRVARRPRGSALPIRTREEYLRALRTCHADGPWRGAETARESPLAESWRAQFSIVESGADVASDAVLQDCVVLAGGRVERGAVVARSVVCPGGVVRAKKCVVDALVVDQR
jgi:hypothetical protein